MKECMICVTKKNRVTNGDLRKKSRVKDKAIKSKKWRWSGHLARRYDNRIQVTRPEKRETEWKMERLTHKGIAWQQTAQDTVKWTICEELSS